MSLLDYVLESERKCLEILIEEKHGNLQDPDVISASQNLDMIITLYNMNTRLCKLIWKLKILI